MSISGGPGCESSRASYGVRTVAESCAAEDVDVRETARRHGMADADDLVGLALAAPGSAEHLQRVAVADRREAAPEGRRDPTVVGVLHHIAELAVLDPTAPFAAELELVARIVDRPGTIRLHVHPALDGADQLGERAVAGFEIQVGHAVDRRPVPTGGAGVGDTGNTGARLRRARSERALQDAARDDLFAARRLPIVVEAVARQLPGTGRIERDVQQLRAVAIRTEHIERDETAAGVVALIAEDAVELERMADRLVHLQDHL